MNMRWGRRDSAETENSNDDTISTKGFKAGRCLLVSGPTNNGNGPMDYNGSCEVFGGLWQFQAALAWLSLPGKRLRKIH